MPVWVSRTGWVDGVRAWAASGDFDAVRARLGEASGKPLSMTTATLIAVAVVMAQFADDATGRNVAVTKALIAARVGCSEQTVKRAWRILAAAGWAVKIREGHGSPSTPSVGRRPAIWHLLSRRAGQQPASPNTTAAAAGVENGPLPPLGGSSSQPCVKNYSPSARHRAPQHASTHRRDRARRCWRTTPRPLAIQRLAGQFVATTHGLHRGHIGTVCDALTGAGIDPAAWTAHQLADALNTDMRATGWTWPDRIERPGAFLAWRLRRIARTATEPATNNGGGNAAVSQGHNPSADSPPAAAPALTGAAAHARAEDIRAQLQKARHTRTSTPPARRPSHTPPPGSGRGARLLQEALTAPRATETPIWPPPVPTTPQSSPGAQRARQALAIARMAMRRPVATGTGSEALLLAASGDGICVACQATGGVERAEPPLRSVICDNCRAMLAPPEQVTVPA